MFLGRGNHFLHAVQFGAGGRTFVAHGGWVGNWELWEEPFERMQTRWRCIGYDHRGAGASTFGADLIGPKALVDDLFFVLDAYGVDRCLLAGESLGALTCMLAVLREPARFSGLVLVDGVPAAATSPLIAGSRANFPATVQAFVDACIPEPDSEHLRAWARQILLRADPEAAARILEVHAEQAVAPPAEEIAVPTLLIHGELDAIVPVAAAQQLAARIPDSTLHVIEGAGHVPTLTRPDVVVGAIEAWAARLQG